VTGLEGTVGLARLVLRRDRVRLPLWLVGVAGVTYGSGSAMAATFPTQASIDAYAASVASSPAVVAMSGPPIALDTLPGIVLNKIELVTVVGVCLMAALTVVRHSRAEEEAGRTELLRAGVVGRHAGGCAALLVASGASVLLGVLVALGLSGASVPGRSALLYGAGTAGLGVVTAAATLCLAQLFVHARAATGAALALVGLAFVLRAAGDVRGDGLVWLSPVGWSQATHVLGAERWWPLGICVGAAIALAWLAFRLSGFRDVGAGLVAPRPGDAVGGRLMSSAFGLAVRQQRGTVVAWAVGVLALALAEGSLADVVRSMAHDNPALEKYLNATGQGSLVDAYLSTILLVLGLLATAFALSATARLRSEETSGRLEALLATGLTRSRWLGSGLAVVGLGAMLVLLLGGLGLGLSFAATTGDWSTALRLPVQVLVYGPAVAALVALAVLMLGWRPDAGGVTWAALGLCFVLGWLGSLLGLPAWVLKVSPFGAAPLLPLQAFTWTGPVLTVMVAVLLGGVGWLGLLHRDIR